MNGMRLTRVRISLANARTNEQLHMGGRRLFVPFVSSLTASLSVDFGVAANGAIPLSRGFKTKGFGFRDLYLTNTAQPGEWIELMAIGDPADRRDDELDFDFPSPASDVQIVGGQSGSGSGVVVAGGITEVTPFIDLNAVMDLRATPDDTTDPATAFNSATVGSDIEFLTPPVGQTWLVDVYAWTSAFDPPNNYIKIRVRRGSYTAALALCHSDRPKLVFCRLLMDHSLSLRAEAFGVRGFAETSGVRIA